MGKVSVTVIILTFNEERNLPAALDSVKGWAKEVFVVDSFSTDRTVDIALERETDGVRVVQHAFEDYSKQWNWALEHLPATGDLTLKLDADERVTPELALDIQNIFKSGNQCDGYFIPRRLWFMGRALHVKQDVLRLWRTGTCQFSDVIVNEHPLVEGKIDRLKGVLEHYDSFDLHHWWDKQNRYTTMLALQKFRGDKLSAEPKLFGTKLERRMFFIKVFFYIPFRYQFQLIHELFIRGAWRDGMRGLTWARLRVQSRRMRELKVKEMKITGCIPEIPKVPSGDFDQRVLESSLQKTVCVAGNDEG